MFNNRCKKKIKKKSKTEFSIISPKKKKIVYIGRWIDIDENEYMSNVIMTKVTNKMFFFSMLLIGSGGEKDEK